jgi:ABC-type branched-subunit amino acid transport system substrate-binding protein
MQQDPVARRTIRTINGKRTVGTAKVVACLAAVSLTAGACSSSAKKTASTPPGSSSSTASGAPYKVADVVDITGGNSGNGLQTNAGAEAAAYAINHSGGVNGHPLDVTSYDSQSTAQGTEVAFRTALSANPTVLTGGLSSTGDVAAASVQIAAGTPQVSSNYPVAQLQSQSFWFSVSPNPAQVAAGAVNGLKAQLGSLTGQTIAFEGLANPAVDANYAAIKSLIEQDGGKVGPVIRDPLVFTSWTSQAGNVAAAHVAGVIINHDAAMTAVVAKALVVAGIKAPIVATEGANTDQLFQEVNAANFYAVRETIDPAPGSPAATAAQGAGVTGSASGSFFEKAWAAMYVIAAALKACGYPCSASSFEAGLKALGPYTVPGSVLMGPVDFSHSSTGLTTAQVWGMDPSSGKPAAKGPTFPLT